MSSTRGPPDIKGMSSLKVDNLTFRTTTDDLKRVFEKYGEIGDIYIPRDRFSRSSRGFAFVRYYDRRDAEDAMESMDGRRLDGRELRVQMARYGRPETPPYKRKRRRSRSRSRDRRRRRSYSRSRSRSRDRRRKSRSRSLSRSRSRSKSRSRSRSDSKSRSRSPGVGAVLDNERISKSPSEATHLKENGNTHTDSELATNHQESQKHIQYSGVDDTECVKQDSPAKSRSRSRSPE